MDQSFSISPKQDQDMKISIIIPVYQAELYIHKCLDCLLNQTYQDIEIILIDDGSRDKSGEICDHYAQKDQRIRVIHQENGGVSKARQKGLETSTGDYVIHADPDDWVDTTMCEELLKVAVEEDADMVICDFWTEETTRTIRNQEQPSAITSKAILNAIINGQLHGSCCNKLVKRSTIAKGNISFTPSHITVLEDLLFNCRFLKQDNIKISYLPKAFYHYNMMNASSACHVPWPRKIQSEIDVLTELEKIFDKSEFNNFYNRKKGVYFGAIQSKRDDILRRLSPDVKTRFLEESHPFRLYSPVSNCIKIALYGYPRIAYYYYKAHMFLIALKDKLRK